MDLMFSLRQLTETAIQYNSKIYACFVDLELAFDSALRELIWIILERGLDNKLYKAVRSLYTNTRNIVRTHNTCSKEFITYSGVRQDRVLRPLLFISLMDEIGKGGRDRDKNIRVGVSNNISTFQSLSTLMTW